MTWLLDTLTPANPFTVGSISGFLGFLLALAFMGYSATRLFTFKPPTASLDETRLNKELEAILHTPHANPPMSKPAVKGLGYTKDDAAFDAEIKRRHLQNIMSATDRRRS